MTDVAVQKDPWHVHLIFAQTEGGPLSLAESSSLSFAELPLTI